MRQEDAPLSSCISWLLATWAHSRDHSKFCLQISPVGFGLLSWITKQGHSRQMYASWMTILSRLTSFNISVTKSPFFKGKFIKLKLRATCIFYSVLYPEKKQWGAVFLSGRMWVYQLDNYSMILLLKPLMLIWNDAFLFSIRSILRE